MILIGLGSNLTTPEFSSSEVIIEYALNELSKYDVFINQRSKFYKTEPVPKSDQPWFVNAVVSVDTNHKALSLLDILHQIERSMGRIRKHRWEARVIDLDLLAYHNEIYPDQESWKEMAELDVPNQLIIPHGRMHERNFVLIPLSEITETWEHPVLAMSVKDMLNENNAHPDKKNIVRKI
jgi:2-amino-4-hydroxy-6-hydroxymethyldihydropteridine diphosphokinase